MESGSALLEGLRPTSDLKVMDLVEAAGIDVSPWFVKENGEAVSSPKANPNFCYEWAFGESAEPIVLCVWHEQVEAHGESVAFTGNLKARATDLEAIAQDRLESGSTRGRAKKQAKRCDAFDFRIQRAFRQSLPVRVILLTGERADKLGHDASKVSLRSLDSESWGVQRYDEASGQFTLVRGIAAMPDQIEPGEEQFVDQFSAPGRVENKERTVDVFVRSAEVRRQVLRRAGGNCEHCGRRGFATAGGGVYLETHHVIPLSEGGEDVTFNVVAVCPDDHRRAHYALDRMEIRSQLLAHLATVRRDE